MLVKICGTTSLEDAHGALAAGADALGFIFAPSRRRVNVETAAAITRTLPADCLRVGVFSLADAAEIAETVRAVGLSAVQMHFAYDEAVIAALHGEFAGAVQLWQVIAVSADGTAVDNLRERLEQAFGDPRLSTVLLDAAKEGASGGLGTAFPWAGVQEVLAELGERRPRLIVAGGLHAGNVREAVAVLRPDGVDAVSGVEAEPGRKDLAKVRAFVEAAQGGGAVAG